MGLGQSNNFKKKFKMENNNQNTQNPNNQTTVIVNQVEKKSNGVGIAGFVLALCALFFSWTPGLNWILWALGLILSLVGIFRKPKGLAIAGLIISCLGLILLIVLASVLASIF